MESLFGRNLYSLQPTLVFIKPSIICSHLALMRTLVSLERSSPTQTPLFNASCLDNVGITEELLRYGFDINIRDLKIHNDLTPACHGSHSPVTIRLFL